MLSLTTGTIQKQPQYQRIEVGLRSAGGTAHRKAGQLVTANSVEARREVIYASTR